MTPQLRMPLEKMKSAWKSHIYTFLLALLLFSIAKILISIMFPYIYMNKERRCDIERESPYILAFTYYVIMVLYILLKYYLSVRMEEF